VAFGGFYGALANGYVTAAHVLGLPRLLRGAPRLYTRVESAWLQHLKLKSGHLISRFAFNVNLRPYRWGCW